MATLFIFFFFIHLGTTGNETTSFLLLKNSRNRGMILKGTDKQFYSSTSSKHK